MSIQMVKRGGEGHEADYKEFLISAAADVANLPTKTTDPSAAYGSVAYTQGMEHMYMLGLANIWREV